VPTFRAPERVIIITVRISPAQVIALCALCFAASGCGGASSATTTLGLTPSITGISPTSTFPGGQITITGSQLNGTLTVVNFAGGFSGQATATAGTATSVTVNVPSNLAAGTYNVSVYDTDTSGDTSSPSNSLQISVL
jgi:hypothetical protein